MPDTDAATTTDTGTTTDDTSTSTGTTATDTSADTVLADIKALADELGITPGQIKGRLDASRKWEQRAKDNSTAATELAELRKTQMSEQERAVAEAKQTGETEATSKFAQRLAAAEIKAALTGIVADPSQIVDDLNLAKYVTETGDVDAEAVTKLRDKFAAFAKPTTPADFGGGNRGGDTGGKSQLTKADVTRLTKERKFAEIEQARSEGRLADVLSGKS